MVCEFAGVHAISLSPTPSLVPVNLVRSSGTPALTGHYLVVPRDDLSSETKIFVTDVHQNIPLSGFIDLEPGDLLGTSSPLIQIPLSALHGSSAVPLTTTLHTTGVHALRDNIPVADDGLPSTDTLPTPSAPCPELLARLSTDQRTSFLPTLGSPSAPLARHHIRPTRYWLVSTSHRGPGQRHLRVL